MQVSNWAYQFLIKEIGKLRDEMADTMPGQKIEQIMKVRTVFGCRLKEAKDIVEQYFLLDEIIAREVQVPKNILVTLHGHGDDEVCHLGMYAEGEVETIKKVLTSVCDYRSVQVWEEKKSEPMLRKRGFDD